MVTSIQIFLSSPPLRPAPRGVLQLIMVPLRPAAYPPGDAFGAVGFVEQRDVAALEERDQRHAGDKAADVGEPGHPSPFRRGECGTDQLYGEPQAQHPEGRQPYQLHEEAQGDQHQHPGAGIEYQVRAQHAGNRAAGADHGDL